MEDKRDCLTVTAPDWGALDTIGQQDQPFILWKIGDQALLAHWFDEAFNQGCKRIRIHVADRPNEVRKFCAKATLWPIEKEVVSDKSIPPGELTELNRLPWQPAPESLPHDGWSLLHFWHELETSWFDHYKSRLSSPSHFLSIGRHCQIHPSVELVPPYWIGDEVSIGPGCKVGPCAAVGEGSLLAGESRIVSSRIENNTYLAPETELRDAWLGGNVLINFRHNSIVRKLDAVIAGEVSEIPRPRIGYQQRLRAWQLQRVYAQPAREAGKTAPVRTFECFDGRQVRLIEHEDPRIARWHCYADVIRGKLPLVGIPPYPREALESVPAEWKHALIRQPVGLFGLSDIHCTANTPLEDRLLHDVYQAESLSEIEAKTLVNAYLRAST